MYPLRKRTLAFIDVETTGLDAAHHEVIEYAIILEDRWSGTQEYSGRVIPQFIERASPKALEVNGYTPEKWRDALPAEVVAPHIANLLKDTVLIGHNVRFDAGFISEMLKRAGVEARIDYHLVDTVTLAWEHLAPLGLKSLSLKNVCKFIGAEPEQEPHGALGGARKCREVYHILLRANWLKRLMWRIRKRKG